MLFRENVTIFGFLENFTLKNVDKPKDLFVIIGAKTTVYHHRQEQVDIEELKSLFLKWKLLLVYLQNDDMLSEFPGEQKKKKKLLQQCREMAWKFLRLVVKHIKCQTVSI